MSGDNCWQFKASGGHQDFLLEFKEPLVAPIAIVSARKLSFLLESAAPKLHTRPRVRIRAHVVLSRPTVKPLIARSPGAIFSRRGTGQREDQHLSFRDTYAQIRAQRKHRPRPGHSHRPRRPGPFRSHLRLRRTRSTSLPPGLTIQQQDSLRSLNISLAQDDAPSTSHYTFNAEGEILGFYGEAFSRREKTECENSGRFIHLPRQVLRRRIVGFFWDEYRIICYRG